MLLLLAISFVGMAAVVLRLALGEPAPGSVRVRESAWLVAAPAALAATVLMLGVFIPGPLQQLLLRAATSLGGAAP